MSFTAVVALLQSALLLLTAAQSATNLPQSFRDNAIVVAQEAISQATLALSQSPTTTSTAAATTDQYFNPPSGTNTTPSTNTQTTPIPSTSTSNTTPIPVGNLAISVAPGSKGNEFAAGSMNFTLANIVLDASQSGEDVHLSSLPIVVNDLNTSTESPSNLASDLTGCQLIENNAVLATNSVGGSSWNSTTNPLTATFTFNSPLTIPKGTVITLGLQCNLSNSIPGGTAFSFSAGNQASATGVQIGDSITPTVENGTSGTITVSMPTTLAASFSPPPLLQTTGGATGVIADTFTLTPSNGNVDVQAIGFSLNSTYASSSDVLKAYVYTPNYSATPAGTITFTGSPKNGYYYATTSVALLNLPQNEQTPITIKFDAAPIGIAQPGTAGHEIFIGLAGAQGYSGSGSLVNLSTPVSATQGVILQSASSQ